MLTLHCQLGERQVLAAELQLRTGLCAGVKAKVTPAHTFDVQDGEAFQVTIRDEETTLGVIPLKVDDYLLEDEGYGWLTATDEAVTQASRFKFEAFGSGGGVAWSKVLSSRVPIGELPEALTTPKFQTITVSDIRFAKLLDHIASESGLAWHLNEGRLVWKTPTRGPARQVRYVRRRKTRKAVWIRTETWLDLGTLVEADGPCGKVKGIVREAKVESSLTGTSVWFALGEFSRSKLYPAKYDWTVPGLVDETEPLSIKLDLGGQSPIVPAEWRCRNAGAAFVENIPVKSGCAVEVRMRRGGVDCTLPAAYLWSPGRVADHFSTKCESRIDNASHWEQSAKSIQTSVDEMEIKTKRLDINKLK